MSSKKNGTRKLFENMPVEPDEVPGGRQETGPVRDEQQAGFTGKSEQNELIVPETGLPPQKKAEPGPEDASPDDILEDVRRSLIEEEEASEKEEQPRWWKRIRKGSRKHTEPETPQPIEEISLPSLEAEEPDLPQPEPELAAEEDQDPIDELIDLLEEEEAEKKLASLGEPPPAAPEPEKVMDVEELKKQAFQQRSGPAAEDSVSEVRAIALKGDEEVFVEVQSTSADPLEERISAVENALHPYRRYINFGLAFLGLVMAVLAAFLLYNAYQRSVAASATPEPVSNLPFPTSVRLPGGWVFNLGKGSLTDGRWDPKGAEWLQGTEVCRWVALPWSRQLEAVLRTLNPKDPIELGMSNKDILTYKVYSIEQLSPEEMQKLDTNTPCLLIVLPEPEADKRWVLTALP